MDRIQRLERHLLAAERILLTVLVVGMTLLGFVQIVLRKAFSGGFLWADVLLRHAVLWVAFLGAGIAAAQDKHFGADLGERFFAGRQRSIAQLVVHAFAVIVCALLARASLVFIREEFASAPPLFTLGGLRVPGSLYEIILPIGFLLLLLHYALKAVADVLEMRK